ncbi:hypothetical protein BS78_02G015800 [Paspalum vaginatum]|nr:hypothetical protein BS78_02G015800 [Paspalum vaginatum]
MEHWDLRAQARFIHQYISFGAEPANFCLSNQQQWRCHGAPSIISRFGCFLFSSSYLFLSAEASEVVLRAALMIRRIRVHQYTVRTLLAVIREDSIMRYHLQKVRKNTEVILQVHWSPHAPAASARN